MILDIFSNVFALIIVTLIIVVVHEYGHYLIAKLCGAKVEVFSAGFGPKLLSINDKSGTAWQLRALPLGGYVKIKGQDASFEEDAIDPDKVKDHTSFLSKKPWQKALIVLAGPAFNFLLAFIIMFAIFNFYGKPESAPTEPIIMNIAENSPAAKAGIRVNDKIISIDGQKIETVAELLNYLNQIKNHNITLEIINDNIVRTTIVELGPDHKMGIQIGNSANVKLEPVGFFESITESANYTYSIAKLTITSIGKLFIGEESIKQLGGVIRIAETSGGAMRSGMMHFLFLLVLLSINLGVINLLPIPGLDGGHLVFYILDCLYIGKFIKPKFRAYAITVGFIFLIGLMAFANFNDLYRIFFKH